MTKVGGRLVEAAREARAIARSEVRMTRRSGVKNLAICLDELVRAYPQKASQAKTNPDALHWFFEKLNAHANGQVSHSYIMDMIRTKLRVF